MGLGGGRSATSSGAPPSSGFTNTYSCAIDGTDDYIQVGDIGTAGRSLGALSFWANADDQFEAGSTAGNIAYLFGFKDVSGGGGGASVWDGLNYGHFATTTAMFTLWIGGGIKTVWNVTAGDKLPVGWHHIVINHNGTGYTFYVDGVIATSNPLGGSITTSSQAIITGAAFDNFRMAARFNPSSIYPLKGKIDEVALFDAALTAGNISTIYNSGTPGDLTAFSPSGWWRMGDVNGASGTTITDQGSGGNNGTLTNGPTYSTNVPS